MRVAILIMVILWPGASFATLIGDEVLIQQNFPTLGSIGQQFWDANGQPLDSVGTVTVGDGFEAEYPNTYRVDVQDSRIVVTILADPVGWNSGGGIQFNGLYVGDLNYAPGDILLGVSVSGTPPAQFPSAPLAWSDSRIYFGTDWVAFDWQGLGWYRGNTFVADLTFGPPPPTPPPPSVPEPATLLLLGSGLAGLGGITWRRHRRG